MSKSAHTINSLDCNLPPGSRRYGGSSPVNRHERRKARNDAAKKRSVGDIIFTQTITAVATGELYWFECSRDFSVQDGIPGDAVLHGPFETSAELNEDQRRVLFGPQCEVSEGGSWDPAWDKPQ
jgi:hypothetical protein